MKSVIVLLFCIAGNISAQDEYDRFVEKRHLTEDLQKHLDKKVQEAEEKRERRLHPRTGGSVLDMPSILAYITCGLGVFLFALLIAVLCTSTSDSHEAGKEDKSSNIVRSPVPTPESIGLAAMKAAQENQSVTGCIGLWNQNSKN